MLCVGLAVQQTAVGDELFQSSIGTQNCTNSWGVILQAVLKDPEDPTMIKLIFANQTQDDILLEQDLDALAQDQRFCIHYLLSRPKDGKYEKGSVGRVTQALMVDQLFGSSETTLALLCGPQVRRVCQLWTSWATPKTTL